VAKADITWDRELTGAPGQRPSLRARQTFQVYESLRRARASQASRDLDFGEGVIVAT